MKFFAGDDVVSISFFMLLVACSLLIGFAQWRFFVRFAFVVVALLAQFFLHFFAFAEGRAREGWRRFLPERALDWTYWSDEDLVKELLSQGLSTFRCEGQHLQSASASNSGTTVKLTYSYFGDGRLEAIVAEVNGKPSCRRIFLRDNQQVDANLGADECRLQSTSAATECCSRGQSCTALMPAFAVDQ